MRHSAPGSGRRVGSRLAAFAAALALLAGFGVAPAGGDTARMPPYDGATGTADARSGLVGAYAVGPAGALYGSGGTLTARVTGPGHYIRAEYAMLNTGTAADPDFHSVAAEACLRARSVELCQPLDQEVGTGFIAIAVNPGASGEDAVFAVSPPVSAGAVASFALVQLQRVRVTD